MIQAQFIYVLKATGYDDLILNGQNDNNLPRGFDEQRVSITRSPQFYGLFRNYTTSLEFVTTGMLWIQKIYEIEGTEFTINIGIYEYNELPVDSYLLYFSGLVDLSTYTFNETFVSCDINESSLARKIMTRDDVKVNLARLSTVEGEEMEANTLSSVNLHEREIKLTGTYELDSENATVSSSESPITNNAEGFALPIKIVASDIENLVTPVNSGIDQANTLFWENASIDSTFTVTGNIVGTIGVDPTDTQSVVHSIVFRIYDDNTFATWTDSTIWFYDGELEPGQPLDIELNTFFATITSDQIIALIAVSEPQFGSYTATFTQIDIEIEQNQLFDITTANGYLLHESMDRIINTIADDKVFYSDFLGRTDIGYSEKGEGSMYSIHSGKQISGVPDVYPSLSLSEGFRSLNAIFNLGIGIEYDSVSQPFIRLEEKRHFFSGDVIATIHSVNEIQKTVAREWIYNDIQVGYSKSELEFQNGRTEYNNKFNWTTAINTIKNKLDLVSTIRADGYGIEKARRFQYSENPTEDGKEDNDNFIVNIIEDGGNYKSVRNENYDFVENIFSPESAYNLDITPGRMLRKHGHVIRPGVEKYLDKEILFHYAEQKSNMRSQKTGESVIDENEDIDPNTLDSPLWKPEQYSFKSVLTREQLAAISKNPSGIIKFSTTTQENTTKYYYGWILNIEAEDNEATWELLAVDLSSPDVSLIDPEGSSPSQPPIIVDPSKIYGVFEGDFEFVFSG